LNTEVITSLDGFNALREDWNSLLPGDDGNDLPLSWMWFDAWLQGFWRSVTRADPRARLHILVVRDDQGIAAIAPMAIHELKYHGFRVLMTHSLANGSTPYWDLVLRSGLDEPTLESICSAVFTAAPTAVTLLSRLRDSSPVRRYLARLQRNAWNDLNLIRTPLVHCSGTLEAHLGSLSRKYRRGLRKKLKTFDATADTRVERHQLGSSHDPLFDQMVAVSRRSWKSAHGSDLGSHADHRQFLSAMVDQLGPLGRAEIWIAYRGDEAIACELHMRSGRVTFPIQADYCESARSLSPGSVVEHHALAAAFEDPVLDVYDSCAADYWYLQRLTDSYREAHDTMIFSSDPRARLIQLAEFGAKPVLIWLRRAFSRAS
jgi:CelD/BcsL family acetyltransferase involved in cellulose biosynthesis